MSDDDLEDRVGDNPGTDSDTEHSTEPTVDPTQIERLSGKARELSDKIFNLGVDGRGPWKGSIEVAEEHLTKHGDVEQAIQRLIATHARLTSGTGFLTGLGGLLTLPVALPADFAALWITQARLAGAIAHLRGYDLRSEEVRSVVLISLIGSSATEVLSQAGVQIGTKSAISAIKQVPGRVLIQINKTVGFRLITKAGTKGVVNLTKLAPIVGGVIGGGINLTSTRAVGAWAKKNFPATNDRGASAPAASDGVG
ncbi:EcsC family protein [Herbidospora cretacea]|uniref:EcsC family protein n=1 Tax=Herbidospora cretacea TaxID=28444 RepID=UPI000691AC91|nr:EcsC family protein [Herbidospora cretacea]